MSRIEVGTIPPQHPGKLQSSNTALPSRAPKYPQYISENFYKKLQDLSLSLTERFRTGHEGVIFATQKELEKDVEFTIPKERISNTNDQQIIVAIASNNDNKVKDMISVVSNHASVINIPDAKEEHTLSSKADALSKAKSAAEILSQTEDLSRRAVKNRPHLTIATDEINKRLTKVVDDTTGLTGLTFEPLGKPSNLKDIHENKLTIEQQEKSVQSMFGDFAKMSKENDWQAVPYTIEMSTVIYNPNDPENLAISTQKSSVFLTKEGVNYLATDEGFEVYKNKVKEAGFDITQIAGGFELDVLDKMGFVQYITGTPSDISNKVFVPQRPEAKNHAYSIAVGNVDAKLVAAYFESNVEENSYEEKNTSLFYPRRSLPNVLLHA